MLSRMLTSQLWLKQTKPFEYIHVKQVFEPEFYVGLENRFSTLLLAGLSDERSSADQFARIFPGYDAYGMTVASADPAFSFLYSSDWNRLFSGAFGIETSGRTRVELHHHTRESRPGRIHNDFNPGWFTGLEEENISCNYRTGECKTLGMKSEKHIRAITILIYLANGQWSTKDGGGTGIFQQRDGILEHPDYVALPEDNSLLAFACSPFSYHTFLGNNKRSRNAIVMWLHQRPETAQNRWGTDRIVEWR